LFSLVRFLPLCDDYFGKETYLCDAKYMLSISGWLFVSLTAQVEELSDT
jgi:hypothetical protein